jgi:hypothetical protein
VLKFFSKYFVYIASTGTSVKLRTIQQITSF